VSGATDLLLHLVPCRLEVDFHERRFVTRQLDAVGWLRLILAEPFDLYEIFPRLAGVEAIEHVEDLLWAERVTSDDVAKVGLEMITTAGDRPWWVTLRLINSARDAWDKIHVNNAEGMAFAGWLDEIWSQMMNRFDPKKVNSWIAEIESPPKGFESSVDFNAEERAFMAAMKAVM
jgi:hypothetical protein